MGGKGREGKGGSWDPEKKGKGLRVESFIFVLFLQTVARNDGSKNILKTRAKKTREFHREGGI